MVSVQQQSPAEASVAAWLESLSGTFTEVELDTIRHACELAEPLYADQFELTGAPLMQHALGAAAILVGMNMDADTVMAAILHAVPELMDDWAEIIELQFGSDVRTLVGGLSRLERIQHFSEMLDDKHEQKRSGDMQQAEALRQMLLAMVEDIRVVLIKLAERTQTLRCLSGADDEHQKLVAHETQSIFAPLANRLGVWQMKWELEDLSLRYLEPELYKKVAKLLDERRVDREQYIADVKQQLREALDKAGIKAEVSGRPKHIYSIINKMKRKQLEFSELYDVRAVRILVDDIKDCYAALSVVHELWQQIPSEFDDYIAHPKSNDYRSLHTAVHGPRGLALEVQIRTYEMHQHSELGVAAHWRYKEGGKSDARFDAKITWLRQILEWKNEVADRGDMLQQFRSKLFHEQVYVLTPQGKVIDLPKGATPVDFAYTLHTGLGHRTRGAKVDGSIVPLNYKLQTGQRVEILTAKQGAPSRDWLNPALGYLQSKRAKAKVRHWFKYQDFDEDVAQGRSQLDRELHRHGADSLSQEKLAQRLHFDKLEEMLAAIGRGDVATRHLTQAIQEECSPRQESAAPAIVAKPVTERATPSDFLVEGVGNLMTRVAKCCKPVPPDEIVGYVTRDRGITVHRSDCPSMLRLGEQQRARLLKVQWGGSQSARYAAVIEVEADDRQGLLRDIGDLFVREKVNVSKVDSQSRNLQARMRFTVEVENTTQLDRLLMLLQQVAGVGAVHRIAASRGRKGRAK